MVESSKRQKTGVILIDHGSRRQASNQLLEDVASAFLHRGTWAIVEPAHMELAEPSLQTAWRRCLEAGATSIVVFPYFLSPGRHWDQDIPRLCDEAAKETPGIPYLVTAPLGLHPLILSIIEDRIQHCLQRAADKAQECDLCQGTGRCLWRRNPALAEEEDG